VSVFNTPFLYYLCEYRHISENQIPWSTFNVNHGDVMAPKAAEFGKITHNNGHLASQGHLRSPISVVMENPRAIFYVCTILPRILYRFRYVADDWSNFRCRYSGTYVPLFSAGVNP